MNEIKSAECKKHKWVTVGILRDIFLQECKRCNKTRKITNKAGVSSQIRQKNQRKFIKG